MTEKNKPYKSYKSYESYETYENKHTAYGLLRKF